MPVDAGGYDGAPGGETQSDIHRPSIELTEWNDQATFTAWRA